MKMKTKRVIADLPAEAHAVVKARAAEIGLSVKEIMRRLLFAWVTGKIKLPEK